MIKKIFEDRKFYSTLVKIALPIVIQNLIMSSLNLVDVFIIGGLGQTAIASVGLANQYFFLLNLLLFGISSGSAIFTAQYWGKRDVKGIRKVLGLCLMTGVAAAAVFTLGGLVFPRQILGLFSNDPVVVAMGSAYLRIIVFSYIVTAVTFGYSVVLRSTGNAKVPMFVSMIALGINTVLNILLVYGYFCFPKMGVQGSAVATTIARFIEVSLLLFIIYGNRLPVAASLKEMRAFNGAYVLEYFKVTLPVIANESFWALGVSVYQVVYAHMGTDVVASTQLSGTIERITWVLFMGLGNCCAIMIGNKLGQGESEIVIKYAKRFLKLGTVLAVFTGVIVIAVSPYIVNLMDIPIETREFAQKNLIVFSCIMWERVLNFIIIIGILRSGGDTIFCAFIDLGGVWLVGIPMAFVGGFWLKLPVYWVYAMVSLEETFKLIFGIPRVNSKRWINNLNKA
ncbi:MAG: MATE family efflux transporter [Bacillota bacterium]|nr:MATE family efflux transporter [Bacillota bacterium]